MSHTVLVTGADGFIGSHLTEELVKRGEKVRARLFSLAGSAVLSDKKQPKAPGLRIVPDPEVPSFFPGIIVQ